MRFEALLLVVGLAFCHEQLYASQDGGVECVAVDGQAQLRTLAGEVIGELMSGDECQAILPQAERGFVCGKFGSTWNPVFLENMRPVGKPSNFALCLQAISAARAKMVCGPLGDLRTDTNNWKPIHGRTGVVFGRYGTSLADCRVLTDHASPGLICTNTGTYNFRGRKPTVVHEGQYSDKDLLGASGNQAGCTRSTAGSRNGWVCVCNGDFCDQTDWLVYNAQTRKSLGSNRNIDACIAAAQKAGES